MQAVDRQQQHVLDAVTVAVPAAAMSLVMAALCGGHAAGGKQRSSSRERGEPEPARAAIGW
jgi:hypothetical protein